MTGEATWVSDDEPAVTLLFVEGQDIPTDAIGRAIERCGLRAEWRPADEQELQSRSSDRVVIVLRHQPPSLDGVALLENIRQRGNEAPCILLAGAIEAGHAASCIRRGAWDVVAETDLERIGPSVVSALRARAASAASRRTEEFVLRTQRDAFEQLRRLSLRIADAREQERARIARQVHDDIGQALTVLKLDVTWMKKRLPEGLDAVAERAQEVLSTIDMTINHVRSIAQNLRPPILDEAGLTAAAGWAAREFGRRWGIKCVFEGGRDVSLTGDASTAMFRVLQEALTNVARHARATQVEVSLDEAEGVVEMTILDNGCGVSAADAGGGKGVGLMQIREIAASLGGWADIESPVTGGTAVRVTVPSEASAVSPGGHEGSPQA